MIQERVENTSTVDSCVGFRSVGQQSEEDETEDTTMTVDSCVGFRSVGQQSEEDETEDRRHHYNC